ncbi:MAG: MFS transporter [Neomegalonema sp.]|nr:MFS transporter [Neomegalonema sp.]
MTKLAGRRIEAGFATLFAGVFMALAVQMAFLQLWYEENGLSDGSIGLLNALAFAGRVGASIAVPALSDRAGRPGAALTLTAILGAVAAAAHLMAPAELAWLAPLGVVLAIAFAGLIPLGDAACWRAAEKAGFSYRRPRAVGSFAFLVATFAGGFVAASLGSSSVPLAICASLLLAAIGGRLALGWGVVGASGRAPIRLMDGLKLLRVRRLAVVAAASAAVQASHAVFYVYGSIHWRSLEFSKTTIGALWAWGVLAEIILFFWGGRLLQRLDAARCLMIGGSLAAVRWAAMAFDPGVGAAAVLQTLHAGSFALTHLATIAYIAREAPPELAGSAQGVLSGAVGGVAMALAASLAAWAYPAFGAGAYWLGCVCAALGAGLAVMLGRRRA